MRIIVLSVAVAMSLAAFPAFAGSFSFDLPNLTFPSGDQTTASTKNCVAAPTTAAPVCK